MWVRIDEISFAADRADDVIAHTRNNAVATHQGESFLGFRLLVDRPHGRALNVSYWDDLDEATRNKSGPVVTAAAPGSVPFALSFDRDANLIVAGAAGVASSYSVHRDGTLTAISTAVPNGQSATCWTVFARGHLYAANAGSATITGYTDRLGKLALRESTGVTAHTDTGPIDLAVSGDDRYLYQLATGAGVIDEYRIGQEGSLSLIGTVTGLGIDNGHGTEGIAAS